LWCWSGGLIVTRSIEAVARACGAGTAREIRHVVWLFRFVLDELGVLLEYANAPPRPRPVVDHAPSKHLPHGKEAA
jgi:hypothetical protein